MNTKSEKINTETDRTLKGCETCKPFNMLIFFYPLFSKFTKSKNKKTISGMP